jgi:polyisoprenoid-binding protein YceI
VTATGLASARLEDLPGTWTLDAAHSLAAFSVEVGAGPTALRVRIATASVSSGNALRDELVRSPDFLDSARSPR